MMLIVVWRLLDKFHHSLCHRISQLGSITASELRIIFLSPRLRSAARHYYFGFIQNIWFRTGACTTVHHFWTMFGTGPKYAWKSDCVCVSVPTASSDSEAVSLWTQDESITASLIQSDETIVAIHQNARWLMDWFVSFTIMCEHVFGILHCNHRCHKGRNQSC